MSQVYHKCLGKFGYILRKDNITEDQEKKILNDLTVKTTVLPAYKDFQKPKIYKIYYHSPLAYYIPRFYGIDTFGPAEYMILSKGEPLKEGHKCLFDPLPHQMKALEKARKIFDPSKEAGDGGVLSLPCGYGKTYCATKIVTDYLKLSALIIVPTECLMYQWIDAITEYVPDARVGRIQRDHVDVKDKDFVVAMIHSIAMKNYGLHTFSRFGVVIYDECHHLSSELFSKSMMKIRTRFILGLSATPHREDGLSHVFYKFMGPLFHTQKRAGKNTIYIKKITLNSNSENYKVLRMSTGITNTSGITTAISKLTERNILIVFCIRHLIQQGRKILLLSSRREHLKTINDLLDAEGIKHPSTGKYITYGYYWGKKGLNRLAHRAVLTESSKCDVVLGIDTIAKEGLDIKDLNTLIFATPAGRNVEQPIGRILRKFHKDLNPLVIDLVDNTANYVKHSKDRDSWYKEEGGYVIQNHKVQLSGTSDWNEPLQSYIHTTNPLPQRKEVEVEVEVEAEDVDPVLDECFLLEKEEVELAVKAKRASKVKCPAKAKSATKDKNAKANKFKRVTKEEPSESLCLLPSSRPVKKSYEKRVPDFGNLFLP